MREELDGLKRQISNRERALTDKATSDKANEIQRYLSAYTAEIMALVKKAKDNLPDKTRHIGGIPSQCKYLCALSDMDHALAECLKETNRALEYWNEEDLENRDIYNTIVSEIKGAVTSALNLYKGLPDFYKAKTDNITPTLKQLKLFCKNTRSQVEITADYCDITEKCKEVYIQASKVESCMFAAMACRDEMRRSPNSETYRRYLDHIGETMKTLQESPALNDPACVKDYDIIGALADALGDLVKAYNDSARLITDEDYLMSDFDCKPWTENGAPQQEYIGSTVSIGRANVDYNVLGHSYRVAQLYSVSLESNPVVAMTVDQETASKGLDVMKSPHRPSPVSDPLCHAICLPTS